jgi:DNA-binding XRE family transcriptional regulator
VDLDAMTPEELKAWRTAHNLSRPQLAEKLGVAAGTVRNWEQGFRQPPSWIDAALPRLEPELIEKPKRGRPPKRRRRPAQRSGGEQGAGTGE